MADELPEPELIRPYVIPRDSPPRRTPAPTRPPPADDPTVVIARAGIADGEPSSAPDGDGVHRRPRRVPAVAVGAVVAVVLLGTYLLWPSDPRLTATPGAYSPTAAQADRSTAAPATTGAAATPSAALARPSATHRPTPSESAATPTPSESKTAFIVPAPSTTAPPPVPGPITGVGGLCVDNNGAVANNGNRIQLYACNGTVAQIWIFELDGTLRVQGKCLRAATTVPGALTDLWDCDGNPGEVWRTTRDSTLVNVASGLCLDAAGTSTGNGTPLDVVACTGGDRQQWRLP